MKGLQNNTYLVLYIISNVIALLMLLAAWTQRRILRVMFFIVFAWASWTNWNEAIIAPRFYLDYAGLTFSNWYRDFIQEWFSRHITLAVGFIATCQALIAISMLLRGWIFKTGVIGAIIFLLAIAPLGVGSAFPCTIVLAIAMWSLMRQKEIDYLWISGSKKNLAVRPFLKSISTGSVKQFEEQGHQVQINTKI
jgi:hypothetical protein